MSTEPGQPQAGKITQFAYDGDGRLVSVTDALNQVTSYGYDEVGNRVSVTDAAGKVTRFAYDSAGRETKRTLPDATYEVKTYDAGGELWTRTDFQGRTTTYGYDVAGRLTSKTYPDSSTVSFGYSSTGRRTSAVDARGTTIYTYDNRDRLTAMQSPDGKRIEYGYDSAGNRTSLTAKVGSTTLATGYTYDGLDRIANVTDPDSRVFGLEYDDVGSLNKLVRPNGVDTKFDHDTLNRLTNIRTYTRSPDTTIASYGYTLGATGIRKKIEEADGTSRSYDYDDLYRLTKETVTGAQTYEKTFGYDAVSNRTIQTSTGDVGGGQLDAAVSSVDASAGGTSAINYTYDSRDRLQTENGTVYSWSANGNLVGRSGEATYEWDFEDRLVQVTKADGTVVENVYDVDGVLVRTAVNGVGTDYLVDTSGGLSHVVAEVDASGAVTVLYVRAGDMLLEEVRGGVAKMYEADGLGSVRGLLDVSGAKTDAYSYEAFGSTVSTTGSDANPYRFAGERLIDSVGFYQNRARWLDTRTGRFVSVDPAEGDQEEPVSLQPYLYANASPAGVLDPSGKESIVEPMIDVVMTLVLGSTAQSQTPAPGGITNSLLLESSSGTASDSIGWSRWWIRWSLARPSRRGGFIVQHLRVKFWVTNLAGIRMKDPRDDGRWNYWEAWEVRPNRQVTIYIENGYDRDDQYDMPGAPGTKGRYRYIGRARFYEGLRLPGSFAPGNSLHAGPVLPSSNTDPKLPVNNATAEVFHSRAVSW